MSVLSISEDSQLSVTAMALRLEYILDLARLLRSSDLLKMIRALHVSTYGNVIFSGETLRSPEIQPRRRRFRLFSCAIGHTESLRMRIISLFAVFVWSVNEFLMRRSWSLE